MPRLSALMSTSAQMRASASGTPIPLNTSTMKASSRSKGTQAWSSVMMLPPVGGALVAARGPLPQFDLRRQRQRVGEPLGPAELRVDDPLDGHLEVLAARLHRHGAVLQHDLPGPLEQPAAVAGDAADGPHLPVERHRLAELGRELHGDAPGLRVGDVDGPADGLVQDGGGQPAVQPARIALVLLAGLEDPDQLPAVQLEEAGLEARGVLHAADQAHAADVLGRPDFARLMRDLPSAQGPQDLRGAAHPAHAGKRRPHDELVLLGASRRGGVLNEHLVVAALVGVSRRASPRRCWW